MRYCSCVQKAALMDARQSCEIKRNCIIFMDSLCESNRFQISDRLFAPKKWIWAQTKWKRNGMRLMNRDRDGIDQTCICDARTALNCIHKCIRPIKGEIRKFGWLAHTHTQLMQTCIIFIMAKPWLEFECRVCTIDAEKDPFCCHRIQPIR